MSNWILNSSGNGNGNNSSNNKQKSIMKFNIRQSYLSNAPASEQKIMAEA